MAGQKAADAFTEWAKANTTKIHADAIDEAAMGFAAGWDAQEAQVARLQIQLTLEFARRLVAEGDVLGAVFALRDTQLARKAGFKDVLWAMHRNQSAGRQEVQDMIREMAPLDASEEGAQAAIERAGIANRAWEAINIKLAEAQTKASRLKAERDASRALVEQLQTLAHTAYERDKPPTREWLDQFCALTEKEMRRALRKR